MDTAANPTRAAILGLGVHIPSLILTNQDLAKIVDTSDEWIVARTGIRRRHVADPDQATSDLALLASQRALTAAGVAPAELDLIVVGTATPDMYFPATACLVQARLGAPGAGAFDLLAACSSFVYGLITVSRLIETGMIRYALVVGAETLTRLVDWQDRTTCVLIGDGAGAAVLGPSTSGGGILSGVIGADGSAGEVLKLPAGGSRIPITSSVIEQNLHRAHMDGQAVFKLAVRTVPGLLREVVAKAGWTLAEVDRIVPHQANLRIIEAVADQLQLPMEKFVVNIHEYGNTSAASVPIALAEAVETGQIRPGMRLALVAFGGGFTYAACTLVWGL